MARTLVAASILLALLACRDQQPDSASRAFDRAAWHLDPRQPGRLVERDWPVPWGVLPEARHSCADQPSRDRRRLVVNLSGSGDMRVKSIDLPLLSGTPTDTEMALLGLGIELRSMVAGNEWRPPWDGDVDLLIHAFRSAPWRAVMEVLLVSRRVPVRVSGVSVATWHAESDRWDGVLAADVASWEAPPTGPIDPVLLLAVVEGSVLLRVGAHEHRFPAGRFLDPNLAAEAQTTAATWIADANRVWVEVDEDLAPWAGDATRVSIRVLGKAGRRHVSHPAYQRGIIRAGEELAEPRPPVPAPPPLEPIAPDEEVDWAYVVKAIDLLLGHGVREIAFPDLEITLIFGDRHFHPLPPRILEDSTSTTEVLLVVTLAVLAAVLVTWAGVGRKRRRPRGSESQ